ncbi:MAG: type IV secretion system DNA-binding domain-containing protein [Candidatus Moranbacteria bacterium]|nr:type IV secretion system DNA-binding domain-containing protein [Candidatus Moranbacteria bacterium]
MHQEITFFAKTNFRNQQRVFGIKTDDRRRHMYVIGKTGMGKTNLLENLVIQDIQHGHGVAFIDPHGDTAEKIIKAIPAHRINDVIYFNPADQEFPLAFNVMESVSLEHRHLVASGLVGVFKKIWADSWGPRLEYILRNAILALLEYPGSTLLGVTRILVDKEYRKRVVDKVTDPVVKSFWVDEFTKWNDRVLQEVIAPIQNKVGQFLSSSLIRNIVGQTKSSFDVREAMDSRKIIVLNLSKGRIGEDNSALLGAMMITKIQLAAMGRVDIEEDERKDFYLYVDEFQNFATESFANILSEARKYRLSLILANQYVSQIDEKVRDAIFGNAGTIISFRIGAADAEFLEKEFEPVFMVNDLVNLPKFNVYLKLMIDGVAGDAFSATVLPPIELKSTVENIEKVIRISRERYTSKKQDVEDKIRRWTGMLTEEEKAVLMDRVAASRAAQQTGAPVGTPVAYPKPAVSTPMAHTPRASAPAYSVSAPVAATMGAGVSATVLPGTSDKPMYVAYCAVCDTEINVPFKPDGKRPTFCRDHLKEYQRTAAKAKEEMERNAAARPGMQRSIPVQPHLKSQAPIENPRTVNERSGVRISTEKPLSLSQMEYIAPKKFTQKPSTERLPAQESVTIDAPAAPVAPIAPAVSAPSQTEEASAESVLPTTPSLF